MGMHEWDEKTDLLAHSLLGYTVERLRLPKDPQWGARPAAELAAAMGATVTPSGIGGHQALRLFRDVIVPATRPMDDPLNLAYIPSAPSLAATLFDVVVSASSIFAGNWEAGAGAIHAENEALDWLAGLAGFPPGAGGCFVSGGSAANLSALVAARHAMAARRERPARWTFAATPEAHSSLRAAARVMDVDVVPVAPDERGALSRAALERTVATDGDGLFAVVCSAGTTNTGTLDDLAAVADVCGERGLWMHVDGAYGGAALVAPSVRHRFDGIERADSFCVDPHKWLFAPYDCAALLYRDPRVAADAHSQHGDYLDLIDRDLWNPSDFAFHLSRRARGLPLWFALATYGTDAFRDAVEHTLTTARRIAEGIDAAPGLDLVMAPDLTVVLFRRPGWAPDDYADWSRRNARDGVILLVPTRWQGETVMRLAVVNPRTDADEVLRIIATMTT